MNACICSADARNYYYIIDKPRILLESSAMATFGVEEEMEGRTVSIKTKPVLTLELSQILANAAYREAKANGWSVTITIVDDGANLIYLAKMDDCQIGSVTVSQEKATAALKFKRPTKIMQDFVKEGNVHIMTLTGSLPIEGGVPIIISDYVVGAIGVSGVTSAQDGQVAAAALAELTRLNVSVV